MEMKMKSCKQITPNEIVKAMFIFLILLSSMSVEAQIPTNFSGSWEYDKINSDKEERGDASFDGTIVLDIKQDSETIEFSTTYFMPGREGKTLRPSSFLASGEISADDSGIDPAKKYVTWSKDNTILTTHYIMTASIDGVAQDFLTATTYKLSEDSKTLVTEELKKSDLNGEKTIRKVYKKK